MPAVSQCTAPSSQLLPPPNQDRSPPALACPTPTLPLHLSVSRKFENETSSQVIIIEKKLSRNACNMAKKVLVSNNKFYIHPNAVSYIYQRSAFTMDKLTDKDKNGLTAVTRSASVWMPRLDTTAVVRGRAQLSLNLKCKIIVISISILI